MKNQISQEKDQEKKSKKKKYLLLLLLLLLLFKIIILYNYFKKPDDIQGVKKENNTVNTDTVIDVQIDNIISDKNNSVGTTNNNYKNEIENKEVEEPTKEPEPEQPEEIEIKEFKVTSKGQKITEDLSIFDDVKYNGKAVIYPSIQNTYYFEISNTLDFNTICEVSFNEKNKENIPIKYRLKENGKYIRGDEKTYIPYDELNFTNIVNSKSENKYELEWKWVEGSNDNYYGDVNKTITYEIELTVKATGETEE